MIYSLKLCGSVAALASVADVIHYCNYLIKGSRYPGRRFSWTRFPYFGLWVLFGSKRILSLFCICQSGWLQCVIPILQEDEDKGEDKGESKDGDKGEDKGEDKNEEKDEPSSNANPSEDPFFK